MSASSEPVLRELGMSEPQHVDFKVAFSNSVIQPGPMHHGRNEPSRCPQQTSSAKSKRLPGSLAALVEAGSMWEFKATHPATQIPGQGCAESTSCPLVVPSMVCVTNSLFCLLLKAEGLLRGFWEARPRLLGSHKSFNNSK